MTAVLVLRYTFTRSVDTLVSVTTALVLNRAHLVAEALNPNLEPKTVTELADACDLTDARVREALDAMTDDGTVYRVAIRPTLIDTNSTSPR